MLTIGIGATVITRTATNNSELFTRLIIGVLIYSTILSQQSFNNSIQEIPILGGLFHTNNLINGIEMYIYIISILLILFLIGRKDLVAEYRLVLGFSILGAITLIESYDIYSTFLAIELQSLSLYVIATITRKEATAAGLKYFLLGSLSSAIFLLGLVIIYSLTGVTQYDGFNILYALPSNELGIIISGETESYNKLCNVGITFIAIGLLFKIGAAPFHSWAPDVYDNVPTIITSWLAIMGKISILSFIFVFSTTGVFAESLESFSLLTISATLSLLIGSILGLVQYKIKRLLAYSSISHLGFLLIGLSIDSGLAASSFLFYMFQYWLSLISIFAILIYYESGNSSIRSVSNLGFLKFNPALIFALIISLFSLTGIPPLIGFFGKQMILYTSLLNGYYFISTVAICTSVISAAYYLRIVKTIGFVGVDNGGDGTEFSISTIKESNISNKSLSWIISIISLMTLSVFQTPSLLLNLAQHFVLNNLF
uniref:NADH-ubiquinone oxidoreductase chain 2 n=1 Tax=Blastocladiella sp. TaxID=2169676 RepID=A0A890JKS2_9FUNG|nr:NADH dehydrogenase subunit 2 [Blastocladiella sp.]